MAFRILDRAQMSVTGAPGTGNITLGVNTTGYQTFAQAGLTDGDTFSYIAVDGTAWEYGVGTYTLATGVVARTPTKTSAQSATPLSLSSKTVISATLRGEDIQSAGTTLAGLSDVSVTEGAAIDGYTLNWSNSTGRWVAVAPVTAGGGGSTTLAALTDVQETSPASGQYLQYNGTKWINASLPTIPTTIETLTDVTVTSPTSGQVLEWNGSAWVNSTISGGGGGALIIDNNGTLVDSAATTLNFVNATSITTSSHNVTVTLPTGSGGGGSGNSPPSAASFSYSANGTGVTASVAYTAGKSLTVIRTDGGSNNQSAFVGKAVPGSTPWSATMQYTPIYTNGTGYPRAGMGLYNSSSGKLITFGLLASGTSFNVTAVYSADLNSYTSNIGTAIGMVQGSVMPTWFRIRFDGTTYTFSYSWDDVQYFTYGTALAATYFTADKVGVSVFSYSNIAVLGVSVTNYYEGT